MPTYFEQREKIIQAYFRDEIKPYERNFCFCGTLCNNTDEWFGMAMSFHNDSHGYRGRDFVQMETVLLMEVDVEVGPDYEDQLFKGMCAALDVLKEIHRSRGEDVDTEPATPFIQRKPKEVCNGYGVRSQLC